MADVYYVIMAAGATNRGVTIDTDTMTVGSYNLECYRYADSSSQDSQHVMTGVAGDLA